LIKTKLIIKDFFALLMQKLYFSKKTMGKKYVNYFGPKFYNSMPFTMPFTNQNISNDNKKKLLLNGYLYL